MTAGSSPGTSEIASVDDFGGKGAPASRPPLMRERCLRTVLISPMAAPLFQQRPRDRLLLREGEPVNRRDPVRRSAAGKEHQDQIVSVDRVGEREHAFGRRDAGRIGHRMAGLDDRNAHGRPPIAMAGDREPGEPLPRQHAA